MCLEAEMHVMKHYEIVNLKPSESLLTYDPIFKNFKIEFDAIKEHKKKEFSTPQISQNLDVVRWNKEFLDFLLRIVGARNMPLS